MVKAGKVYATATEDMDALTFGTNILLRHLTFSEARKMPVQEFYYDKILEELQLTNEQVTYWVQLRRPQICNKTKLLKFIWIELIFSLSICVFCLDAITANPFVALDRNVPLNWFNNTKRLKKSSKISTKANTWCQKTGIMNKHVNYS